MLTSLCARHFPFLSVNARCVRHFSVRTDAMKYGRHFLVLGVEVGFVVMFAGRFSVLNVDMRWVRFLPCFSTNSE